MGFERLAAAVIVIGLIVWGASILATPDEARARVDVDPVADVNPDPVRDVDDVAPDEPEVDEDDADDERDEEDEEDEEGERRGKGKKDGG